jgi:nicotinate-nucleotide--dimethylbenzimidazole phosphoribosyltransferase
MQTLATLLAAIAPLDRDAMLNARRYIDGLLKPQGSLGRLETLAVQLAGMPGLKDGLDTRRKAIMVMCADHGVYAEGVAAAPQAVTAIQTMNMTRRNTGVCVLGALAGAEVTVVDVGVDSEPLPGVLNMKVARGSGNIATGPAMSRRQAEDLLLATAKLTLAKAAEGVRLFGVGELGMANTTPAAAMVSVFTDSDPLDTVGMGANLPADKIAHKVAVVRRALAINQPDADDGVDVLARVGGFDLVGMTGVMLGAAAAGLPVVLDGYLSYASALAACRIAPGVRDYLIPSHLSAEKGAQLALRHLELEPYLHMGMRLGEGSGAALAMHIVDAACAMYNQMGTLAGSNIELPEGK